MARYVFQDAFERFIVALNDALLPGLRRQATWSPAAASMVSAAASGCVAYMAGGQNGCRPPPPRRGRWPRGATALVQASLRGVRRIRGK